MMNTPKVAIDVNGKGAALGDFYGIFFEDINHAADGGLYAQMIRNASFEFSQIDNYRYNSLTAWEAIGEAELTVKSSGSPFAKNPNYCEVSALAAGENGIRNLGYGKSGMYFKKGEEYTLSFFAKGAMKVRTALESREKGILASAELAFTDEWAKYTVKFKIKTDAEDGSLSFIMGESGRIGLDALALFPKNTYKNGVCRKDLAEALEELKPRFMRFPGGCLVHDGDLDPESRRACYCWKNTIGALEARPSKRNNWGYNQSLGLGYYEYFILCEQLGCEPLPVVPAGWNPHRQDACPLNEMQPWIDDALDLIEFANGGEDTPWGAVRCELGHKKPFKLKYLAIGNEEVGAEFPERYELIAGAVRAKYPKIKLIHSAGPFASGSEYDRGYAAARKSGADLIDEHYYCSPEWLLANVHRYDSFPAKKPKVFLGEYASCANTYYNAVAEAAYMTGLENNARAVSLACYAPLLCHVDYVNWTPDLIRFDNKRVCRSASYYVQKLFSNNLGDYILPIDKSQIKVTSAPELPVSGMLEVVSDGAEGWIWDAKITNLNNGDGVDFGSFDVGTDFKKEFSEINLTNYEFSFCFKKGGGRDDKGITVSFGKNGDKNGLVWQFGGWQNQDCLISSRVNGLSSCLDQHIFRVETNVEYKLVLRVEGRKITTIVNGEVMNVCEDKIPAIEDMYITAAKVKKTGEIIVKAVNVRAEGYKCELDMGEGSYTGKMFSLGGYEKTAENTLDNEAIAPTEKEVSFKNTLAIELPPLSVTVIRVK